MKDIQNISYRNKCPELLQCYGKYIFVTVIFAVFVFYNIAVVPETVPKKSKSSSSRSAERVEWNITTEKPEKVFLGVLQGLSGDWYRMSVSTLASGPAQIDVVLSSLWNEDILIGSFDIATSDDFRYHEIVFQLPAGSFSDIKLVMRDGGREDAWSYTGVRVAEFSLSRLNVRSKFEADRLMPTVAGTIEHEIKILDVNLNKKSSTVFEGSFIAEADFIESIRINAREKSEDSYVLEIREKAAEGSSNKDISLKKVILKPGELDAEKDEWGNQLITLMARLERGKEYTLVLAGKGDATRTLVLLPVEGLSGIDAEEERLAAIVFGKYAYATGEALLSGTKVEDFGDEILYSYDLSGEMNDFFDLFDTHGSVKFDEKERIVAGRQQQRTSFTYRFFTVYPFEKFMLTARQAGESEEEVKLEYSFDNAFWREIPFTQIDGEPQIFSLGLSGSDKQNTVYVRASYNGEDKKTGSFGLDQLSVRAQLVRK